MARSFNGTSDLIAANAAVVSATTVSFSVALWIKAASQTNKFVYSEGLNTNANALFGIGSADTGDTRRAHVIWKNTSNTQALSAYTTAFVFDGGWHHFLFTYSSANAWVMYVDGAPDSSGSQSASVGAFNRDTIGALVRSTTSSWVAGTIEECASWTRQLSAGEAKSLGNGLPASHLGPSHYWPLWGSDSPEPDIGIAAHTGGTLTGTTAVGGGKEGKGLLAIA